MPFDGTKYEQDEVLALLRRARERVARPGGWVRGTYRCDNAVCALGSIYANPGMKTKIEWQAAYCLVAVLPGRYRSVARFNDSSRRTQADIVELFDRAIAMREAQR